MQTVEHTVSNQQHLINAKKLILDRKNWAQGDFAQDEHGEEVGTMSDKAKCFCSLGAVARAMDLNVGSDQPHIIPNNVVRLLDRAAEMLFEKNRNPDETQSDPTIVELNDAEVIVADMDAHDAVLAAFDIAIELAGVDEVAL